ncbi:MAG: VanZ family protein, partial [Gemmatimonadetes bacterium]|nr:VanZ family protein [Gemmatimonadota bacterium]
MALAVVWLTWSPFEFGVWLTPIRLGFRRFSLETVANLGLLVPLAVNLAEWMRTSLHGDTQRPGTVLIYTLLGVAGAAGLIEFGQLFLAARVTSLADWTLNVAGGGLAAALWLRWSTTEAWRSRALATVTAVLLGPVFLLHAQAITRAPESLTPSGWSADASLVVGGPEGFSGTVADFSFCTAGSAGNRCLSSEDDRGARSAFNELVELNDHVRVEVLMTADDDPTREASRIVDYAESLDHRNMTLVLDERDILFRLRTPITGPNRWLEFVLREAIRPEVLTRVRAEYRDGQIDMESLASDVSKRWRREPSLFGGSWIWAGALRLSRPAEYLRLAFGAGVVFFPVGLILGAIPGVGPSRHVLAILVISVLAAAGTWAAGIPLLAAEVVLGVIAYS